MEEEYSIAKKADIKSGQHLFELIEQLGFERSRFLIACDRFNDLPITKRYNELANYMNNAINALSQVVYYVLSDELKATAEEKATIVTTILDEDDIERVARFNEIMLGQYFHELKLAENEHDRQLLEFMEEVLSSDIEESVAGQVMQQYAKNMEEDMEQLVHMVLESKRAKHMRIANEIGKKGLELGLVFCAAALGARFGMRNK